MPRPKGSSKKDKTRQLSSPIQFIPNEDFNWMQMSINRPKKIENDEEIISTSESRVVVNPAVLRYLEQNRNKSLPMMDINEISQESIVIIEDDHWICSTEFLTSLRLAEWILTHQQSERKFHDSFFEKNK
jgi:hypothetical protein